MFKNIAPKGGLRAVKAARKLRREMSLPEVVLWRALRNRPSGLKFRRQYPFGPYILDVFCSEARLAIEIDGEAHAMGARPHRDAIRDASLQNAGFATIRIRAADVLQDCDAVLRWIVRDADARLPLHRPAAPDGPPPHASAAGRS